MAKHNEIGTNGELLAVNFLKKLGYQILESNWRSGKREIDIVAADGQQLVFVEVKTRRSRRFGYPEEAVTPAKQQHLKAAAEDYCCRYGWHQEIRFDVISIDYKSDTDAVVVHFRDAFY